jgi:hypothetical protein
MVELKQKIGNPSESVCAAGRVISMQADVPDYGRMAGPLRANWP